VTLTYFHQPKISQLVLARWSFVSILRLWLSRQHQRKELRVLTADQLRDIGITKAAADREAAKPFWTV
jgi:uncharacterized protein YjiS (DUF1127 family)